MGEMADFYIDRALSVGEELYDTPYDVGGGGYYRPKDGKCVERKVRCKKCGERGLTWREYQAAVWRLQKGGKWHKCKEKVNLEKLKKGKKQ